MARVTKSPGDQPSAPDARPGQDRLRQLLDNVAPAGWRNPTPPGTYDFVVIGAGPAGVAAARAAAALGAKTALIEQRRIGGDRLNVGDIPSKSLIRTARDYADIRDAHRFGAEAPADLPADFPRAMERMRRIQAHLSRGVAAARLAEEGVDVYFGAARFRSAAVVDVGDQSLPFAKALIATGALPRTLPIPGLGESGYLTNETVFDLTERPSRLLVIGGGPLGCELAQAFCRLGCHVILAQDDPMFLPNEERDAAQYLAHALDKDGVEIHLNTTVVSVGRDGAHKSANLVTAGDRFSVTVDEILAGIGRAPNIENLDLEAAGVGYDPETGVHVDDRLRTSNRRVYAAGDVCMTHKFTHAAMAAGRLAVGNALLRKRGRLSALKIPWCTYTDPEIAHVGMYVRDARRNNIPVKTYTVLMHDVDRAVTDGEEDGFVKIHIRDGSDEILGATIVARHAGEMINDLSLAITHRIGLSALADVIHAYPTQANAVKLAAVAFAHPRKM